MNLHIARVIALLVFGLLAGDAAASQEGRDMKLEDDGFVMRPANTPTELQRLKLLPPRTFVARNKAGRRYYLCADPDYCKCVFLGDELAMKNYRDLVSPPPQAPMVIGSDVSPATAIVQDIDPSIDGSIPDGDILDFPFQ